MPNNLYSDRDLKNTPKADGRTGKSLGNDDGRLRGNVREEVGGRSVPDLNFGAPKEVIDPNAGAPHLKEGSGEIC